MESNAVLSSKLQELEIASKLHRSRIETLLILVESLAVHQQLDGIVEAAHTTLAALRNDPVR